MSSDAAALSQDGSKRPSGTGSCCFPKFDLGTREALQAFKGLSALLSFHEMLVFAEHRGKGGHRERQEQRKTLMGKKCCSLSLHPLNLPATYVCASFCPLDL